MHYATSSLQMKLLRKDLKRGEEIEENKRSDQLADQNLIAWCEQKWYANVIKLL